MNTVDVCSFMNGINCGSRSLSRRDFLGKLSMSYLTLLSGTRKLAAFDQSGPSIHISNTKGVEIRWFGEKGFNYNVFYSNSFRDSDWRFIQLNLPGNDGLMTWTDVGDPATTPARSDPKSVPRRFYKVIRTIPKLDRFGIQMRYRAATGGKTWYSTWDNGHPRYFASFEGFHTDPDDPWFHIEHGNATYNADGKGILTISEQLINGQPQRIPRMHVHDPAKIDQWRSGLEATVYGMRVADDNIDYGGIVIGLRTNHEIDSGCDTRGYYIRVRYDGWADIEKETVHGSYAVVARVLLWGKGNRMPFGRWIGVKAVVYDFASGNVKLECWVDKNEGAYGGDWQRITEFEDTGTNFGNGATPCASGVAPAMQLTADGTRSGSESGKPNLTVRFRSDGVHAKGLLYKWASIREITP
jgi:hypothetical protein